MNDSPAMPMMSNLPNLLDRLQDDPYPVYRQFRRAGPVMWAEAQQHWFVMGHGDAMAALRDPRLVGSAADAGACAAARRTLRRGLVQNTFTPAFVERFRPHAQEVVDTLLDKAAARAELELVADLAVPLALAMATDLLGLRPNEAHVVSAWVQDVSGTLAPPRGHRMLPSGGGPVLPTEEVRENLAAALAVPRQGPDDLLGLLLDADGPSGRPDPEELLDICAELLVSAYLSAVDVIGNGVHTLLDHPMQAERLRAEPGLITTGVEELLRYAPPIQWITRTVHEETELSGHTLGPGQTVVVLLGAANRDPEVFEAPDTLDLSREPNHHVSFGRGSRFCLGAPLARMEAQVAIGSLLARFPALRPAGEPRRRTLPGSRGFSSLPLAL
ncbi:cytochrome P450 [Actinobacteria bacterium OK074]|nr:cytochrome P450 [Actinobacteria bacterium OK074]